MVTVMETDGNPLLDLENDARMQIRASLANGRAILSHVVQISGA